MDITIPIILIFLGGSIVLCKLDIKKRNLKGSKKVIAIISYLYFGSMMTLFFWFAAINYLISILIFMHLVMIIMLFNLKERKSILMIDILVITILSIIFCILNLLKVTSYNNYLLLFIGICIYLLPALGYFDRRYYLTEKMKRCTKEIDATIIKVTKSYDDGEYPHRKIYIPTFLFYLDGKEYTFIDSKEIYSYKKFIVGSKVKLFVNPNGIKFNHPNGSDDIFFPISQNERNNVFAMYVWYIITIIVLLIIVLSKILN